MNWKAIREILRPILASLIGDTVRLWLDPCSRLVWWQIRAANQTVRGKPARWARWRLRVLRDRCDCMHDGTCTASEAADHALALLIDRDRTAGERSELLAELVAAPLYRRRDLVDILGPSVRDALERRLPRNRL